MKTFGHSLENPIVDHRTEGIPYGLRVHYKSLGRGKQGLVFIHDWTCDVSFWRFQAPALARKTRVILIDLPGHGLSDKPEIAYTMDLFARAVEAVMRDAGVDRAVLVGHSMGTPVMRQFYRLFPGKTLSLVAVDGSLQPFTTNRAEAEEMLLKPLRGPDYKAKAAAFIDSMMHPQTPAALREEIKAAMLKAPQQVMISAMEGMLDPKIWRADRIDVPLLVLLAKSPFCPADYEAFVCSIAGNVEFHTFEGVGHFLMMEKPELINTALMYFLQRNHLLKNF